MSEQKGKSILVIDDEEIVRTCCMRALKTAGFAVQTATSAAEGLRLLRENRFDFVVTDLKMPNMEGPELIENIKQVSPRSRILVITGYCTADTKESVTAMGIEGYLEKPFGPRSLLEAIESL